MTHKDRGKNGHEEGRSGGAGCCKNLQRGVAILSMSSLRASIIRQTDIEYAYCFGLEISNQQHLAASFWQHPHC